MNVKVVPPTKNKKTVLITQLLNANDLRSPSPCRLAFVLVLQLITGNWPVSQSVAEVVLGVSSAQGLGIMWMVQEVEKG